MLVSLKGNQKVAHIDKLELDKRSQTSCLKQSRGPEVYSPRLPSCKLSRVFCGNNSVISVWQMWGYGGVCVLGQRKRKLATGSESGWSQRETSSIFPEDLGGLLRACVKSASLHFAFVFHGTASVPAVSQPWT